MFAIAFFIGIYSYIIFSVGLLGFLYYPVVFIVTLIFFTSVLFYFRASFKIRFNRFKGTRYLYFFVTLLIAQAIVNLVGVLGPELSFDSLWYHLTLPKLYIQNHSIFHIPGGVFYYSDMPKLTEMLYIPALIFQGETLAKAIHFTFGILILVVIYRISRMFVSEKLSLIAAVLFYSNLVVGWESTTTYIDLSRTFFESMSVWGILIWYKTKSKKWLVESGAMLGLAITSKVLALGTMPIILFIIFLISWKNKTKLKTVLSYAGIFSFFSLLIPVPWFVFSYLHTGNPFYPFFSPVYPISPIKFNPIEFFKDILTLLMKADDPISPLYIIFLPLIIILFKKLKFEEKLIAFFCFGAIIIWYFTPRTGGGRFILPYLPLFSILCILIFNKLKVKFLKSIIIFIIIFVSLISIGYRGAANKKFIPVIFKLQTREEFLSKNLNFNFGDFYDIDNNLSKIITKNDTVLIYGGHNFYYANFSFIHESFIQKGDMFTYILTQNTDLPKRFAFWTLVYKNEKTHIKLYTFNKLPWYY